MDLPTPLGGDTSEVVLALPPDATAPGTARRAVRETFLRWHHGDLVDGAVLAVSELVTNAVKHGLPPLLLRLRRRPADVRMDVADARPMAPTAEGTQGAPRNIDDPEAESGRGLAIVRAVADDSGVEPITGDGKHSFASWHVDP